MSCIFRNEAASRRPLHFFTSDTRFSIDFKSNENVALGYFLHSPFISIRPSWVCGLEFKLEDFGWRRRIKLHLEAPRMRRKEGKMEGDMRERGES